MSEIVIDNPRCGHILWIGNDQSQVDMLAGMIASNDLRVRTGASDDDIQSLLAGTRCTNCSPLHVPGRR